MYVVGRLGTHDGHTYWTCFVRAIDEPGPCVAENADSYIVQGTGGLIVMLYLGDNWFLQSAKRPINLVSTDKCMSKA